MTIGSELAVHQISVNFVDAATSDIRKLIKRCKKKPAEAGYLRMPIELNAMI